MSASAEILLETSGLGKSDLKCLPITAEPKGSKTDATGESSGKEPETALTAKGGEAKTAQEICKAGEVTTLSSLTWSFHSLAKSSLM